MSPFSSSGGFGGLTLRKEIGRLGLTGEIFIFFCIDIGR